MVAGIEILEASTLAKKAPEAVDNVVEDEVDDLEDNDVTDEDNAVANGEDESDEESEDEEEDEDEEDPEDLQETLREKCGELSKCVALKNEFDACESRVSSRQRTEENCAQELLDFVGCVDKCVSKSLFSHLK
ncbi:cytochrome b-c1 complex subunit 6, mitochondrial-like [Xenia sp. Carnegie-2017]|uniref:cytochrome b-c1 complex subunit 6, mitochondrial-like n=1 Tax=Xenia sp. Carnegie-2017 TaxID=2897299 RepID=UPI001F0353A7|nr:cytochrome b-c1 complex subunit 6, mitochondrial-like [Xenia sp. Carnegie-2017]